MTKKQKEQLDAVLKLRELLPPGSAVYTILRDVSRSGMSRNIDVVTMCDGAPHSISYSVAKATDTPMSKTGALRVSGCGMDMGYHIVMQLSYVLHGNLAVGTDAIVADTAGRPFSPTPDNYRPGYSLIQRWL